MDRLKLTDLDNGRAGRCELTITQSGGRGFWCGLFDGTSQIRRVPRDDRPVVVVSGCVIPTTVITSGHVVYRNASIDDFVYLNVAVCHQSRLAPLAIPPLISIVRSDYHSTSYEMQSAQPSRPLKALSHRIRCGTARHGAAGFGVKAATRGAVPYGVVPYPVWKNL